MKRIGTDKLKDFNLNIMGVDYQIVFKYKVEDDVLQNKDGYVDTSTKEIVIEKMVYGEDSKKDLIKYTHDVLKHEIIHTFLYECGLDTSSDWARNEEMVDFFALQFDKIASIFNEIKCFEDL